MTALSWKKIPVVFVTVTVKSGKNLGCRTDGQTRANLNVQLLELKQEKYAFSVSQLHVWLNKVKTLGNTQMTPKVKWRPRINYVKC